MRNIRVVRVKPAKPISQHISDKSQEQLQTSSFGTTHLPPMWGKVLEITGINHVDVELTNGLKLTYVPVVSKAWVSKTDSEESTGRKDIPPVGAKVLILFPDGIIENAFVLCSGFDSLQEWQKSVLLKEGEEDLDIEVDEYDWKFIRNKTDGTISMESPDGHSIILDPDGFKIEDLNGNIFELTSSGFKIEDSGGNTIESGGTSIKINGTSLEVTQ